MSNDRSLAAIQQVVENIYRLMAEQGSNTQGMDRAKRSIDQAKSPKEVDKALKSYAKSVDLTDKQTRQYIKSLDDLDDATVKEARSKERLKKTAEKLDKVFVSMKAGALSLVTKTITAFNQTVERSITLERQGVGSLLRSVSGAQSNIDGINTVARTLNLSLSSLTDIFTKYGRAVGVIGSDTFVRTVSNLQSSFQELGYTAREGAEAVASYIDRNRLMFATQQLNDVQMQQAARRNLESTQRFAQALQMSREELERREKAARESEEAKFVLASMTAQQQEAYNVFAKVYGQDMADTLLQMMRSEQMYGTVAGATGFQSALATGRQDQLLAAMEMMRQGRTGEADMRAFSERFGGDISAEQRRFMLQVDAHTEFSQKQMMAISNEMQIVEAQFKAVAESTAALDRSVQRSTEMINTIEGLTSRLEQAMQAFIDGAMGDAMLEAMKKLIKLADMIPMEMIEKVGEFLGTNLISLIDVIGDTIVEILKMLTGETGLKEGFEKIIGIVWSGAEKMDGLFLGAIAVLAAAIVAPGVIAGIVAAITSSMIKMGSSVAGAMASFGRTLFSASGPLMRTVLRAAAPIAVGAGGLTVAHRIYNTDTEDYRRRVGMDPNQGSWYGDLAARGMGGLMDIGSGLTGLVGWDTRSNFADVQHRRYLEAQEMEAEDGNLSLLPGPSREEESLQLRKDVNDQVDAIMDIQSAEEKQVSLLEHIARHTAMSAEMLNRLYRETTDIPFVQ